MTKLHVLDYLPIFRRSYHATKKFAMSSVRRRLLKLVETGPVVVAVSCKPSESWRCALHPEYCLQLRPSDQGAFYEGIKALKGLIQEPGLRENVIVVNNSTCEAEDIMATLIHKYGDRFDNVHIVGSGGLMWQLVSDRVTASKYFNPRHEYTPATVQAEIGVFPKQVRT